MSTEYNKEIVRRWIEDGWNLGNADLAEELYSVNFTATPMADNEAPLLGIEGVKQLVINVRSAFPDLHFNIEYLVAEDDLVVGAFHVEGTHSGEFFGVPATNKRVNFSAIDVWRFKDGKIAERPIAVADF